MTGESHLEAALNGTPGSGSGESHIANCLAGGEAAQQCGESHILACLADVLVIPGGVTPAFWYDFTDVSTLYQDAARTIPVTTAGQDILGVAAGNGTAGTPLMATNGPTYQTGGQNGLSYADFVASSSEWLQPDSPTFDWTVDDRAFMVVFDYDQVLQAQIPMQALTAALDNLASFQVTSSRQPQSFLSNTLTAIHFNILAGVHAVIAKATFVDGAGNDTMEARITSDATDEIDNNGTILAGTDRGVFVGGPQQGAGNFWNHRIYEVAVWSNGVVPLLNDLETYVTTKYGIAWA